MVRRASIFYGWWVLLACGLIQLYFSATFLNAFSALVNPLVDEFGWSYTLISLAFTFRGLEAGLFAPIVGFFVDRYRPRRLLVLGTLLGALGFFLFYRIQSLTGFLISVIVLGVALSLNSSAVVMTAVAYWFKKRTGLAMGLLSMGAGAGGLIMPAVIRLIDAVGWRTTMVIFAITTLVVITPLCFLVKDPPAAESNPAGQLPTNSKISGDGFSFKEVMRQKAFWLLMMAVLFTGFSNSAILTHQISYFVSVGFTRETAGYLVLLLSISNIVGRLGFGWLGDLIPKKLTFLMAAVVLMGGLLVFAYAESLNQAFPAVVLLGAGIGAVTTLRSVMQLELFGRKAFAAVQGMLLSALTAGSIVSPTFAGWIFDTYAAYRPAWLILAALTLIAIPLILSFPKPKLQPQG